MGTHATIHFKDNKFVDAAIYLHYDGNPKIIYYLFDKFFNWNEQLPNGNRYEDSAYLAARFVYYYQNVYLKELVENSVILPDRKYEYDGISIGIGPKNNCGYVYNIHASYSRPDVLCDRQYY